jgi:hypothetical protein
MPPRYLSELWALETADSFRVPTKIRVASVVILFFCLPALVITLAILGILLEGSGFILPNILAGRAVINLLYCLQLSLPAVSYSFYRFRVEGGLVNGFMSLLFWFSACLFGAAALFYIAASIKRHFYVSST